ncbi:MAG: hypothetical protein NC833_03540 [Candidatus Omnitrophica bacterium]|nr:hypothetical protein [Candidatus Omnitrophota bacterium]
MENLIILIKWLFIYIFVVFIYKKFQSSYLYLIISFCFLIGFILRKFNLYPGKPEPIFIDFLTSLISLLFFILERFFIIDFKISFAIILLPHIIYNIYKIF